MFSKTKVHPAPVACHTQITDSLTNFDYSVRLTGPAGMKISIFAQNTSEIR